MDARPGDRLAMPWSAPGEQYLHIRREPRISIEASDRRKGANPGEDGMVLRFLDKVNFRRRSNAIVISIITAKNVPIKCQPILEAVAGGSNRHDRLSRLAIFLHLIQLLAGNLESAREKDGHITVIKVLQ